MRYTTLIETATLAANLHDPTLAIVDCRFNLQDTSAGERAYEAGHIPGAVYAHVDRDLSGEKTGSNGRHPLPPVETFVQTVGRLGIDASVQVVVYDHDTGGFAARLWWMLRWLGHDGVALLNGGFAKWIAEGHPVRAGIELRTRRVFVPHIQPQMVANAGDVANVMSSRNWRLIDARAPERFRGEIEPVDKVAGHIPGAVNVPFLDNLDANGVFRPAPDLAARFRAAAAPTPSDHLIVYCGSGVTACQNLLAMELAGIHVAKLYPGSWSVWSSDPSRPMATSKPSPQN
jgi:thiosulfate/3-mercaptopyruvate sulfurtransferase